MLPAIAESMRQDKQRNQIKATRITYGQNPISIIFLKKMEKPKKHQIKKQAKPIELHFTIKDMGHVLKVDRKPKWQI